VVRKEVRRNRPTEQKPNSVQIQGRVEIGRPRPPRNLRKVMGRNGVTKRKEQGELSSFLKGTSCPMRTTLIPRKDRTKQTARSQGILME